MNNFLVTNNGYGYGYGHNHNHNRGYGDGYGNGYGTGYGNGYGDGNGNGNGDGTGNGNGNGIGYNLIHSGGLNDIREFTSFQLLKPLIHREHNHAPYQGDACELQHQALEPPRTRP